MKILRIILLMAFVSRVMNQGTCPPINASVSLSSTVEQNGRHFACPRERVTFTCKVNQGGILRFANSHDESVSFIATDVVGSTGDAIPNATFQANLTNVHRESDECDVANLTATWTATTTDATNNTVVNCTEALRPNLVQRKTLTQSSQPSAPTELSCNLTCQEHINSTSQLENGSSLVIFTCQQVKLVISWESAEGMFDRDYYLVNITNVNTKVNIARNVSTTSLEIPAMPNGDYQVLISTVSKCQERSPAAKIDVKADDVIFDVNDTVDPDDYNIGSIIGGCIGVLLIVLLIVILVAAIARKKQKETKINERRSAKGILKKI